jgi:LysR family transcriptional regulator, carnitine catabolism transcriptional activator
MNLGQLRAVVAIVDHGGFTRAATALHIAQPSLSQAVRNLERELGVELFQRSGRRVVATAAGEALLPPARQALRDVETARAAVAAVAGLEAGHVDVVCLPTLAVSPLAGVIGAFRTRHPAVTVRLAEPEDPAALVGLLRSGTCELGFTEVPVRDADDLDVHELAPQEFYAVLAPDDRGPSLGRRPLPVAELAALPLVTTPPGTSTRRQLDEAFAAVGATPTIAVETVHRELLIPLVVAGAGAFARGASARPVTPPVMRRIGVVHRHGPLSPAARAFLDVATA